MSKTAGLMVFTFIVGAVITTYALFKLDFKYSKIESGIGGEVITGSEEFAKEEISTIKVDVDAANFTLKESELATDKIIINYKHFEDFKFTATMVDQELQIKLRQRYIWWNIFWFNSSSTKIEVLIPVGFVSNYEIDVSAGEVDLSNLHGDKAEIRVSAGDVNIKNSNITNGDIHMSAGTINIKDTEFDTLKMRVSAGDIEGKHITVNHIDFRLSAGSIYFNIDGDVDDYNVDVSISAGSCNLSDRNNKNNHKSIKGNVSAGSATFSFNPLIANE